MTGLIATRKSLEAQIARELREGEFYGLANDRIEWLLAERQPMSGHRSSQREPQVAA